MPARSQWPVLEILASRKLPQQAASNEYRSRFAAGKIFSGMEK